VILCVDIDSRMAEAVVRLRGWPTDRLHETPWPPKTPSTSGLTLSETARVRARHHAKLNGLANSSRASYAPSMCDTISLAVAIVIVAVDFHCH
jgi:hypothetical protein